MRIVITAGYNNSLHAQALLSTLSSKHEIVAVIIVKTFSLKRFFNYLRRYGLELVLEKMKSLVLRLPSSIDKETYYIKKYCKENNIKISNLSTSSKSKNIKYLFTDNINSQSVIEFLNNKSFDLVCYAGGGIIRKNLIELTKGKILNAHSGQLPHIKGMNAIEWSILSDIPPTTTIHFIDKGIDTGDILYSEKVPFEPNDTLLDIRGRATVHNVQLLNKVIDNFDYFNTNRTIQNKNEGKQYFVVHKKLIKTIENKLKSKL